MDPFKSYCREFDIRKLRGENLASPPIAVLDSGIDASHVDLHSHVVSAWRVEKNEPCSWEVIEDPLLANNDSFGHGTAVASIICRFAPAAQIGDYCVLGKSGLGAAGMTLVALEHAINAGYRLINMSLAVTRKYRSELLELMEYGSRKGAFIIASQRNSPFYDLGLPAELSYAIGINSSPNLTLTRVTFNSESPIEFSTFATNISVAAAGGGYTSVSGSSYAAPVVTGLCGLLLAKWPNLEIFELKSLLKNLEFSNDAFG